LTELFDAIGKYYDLLYQDKDYVSEVNYIDHLIKKYSDQTCNILEFGFGTGKHAGILVDKGYKIDGIERSKSMVKFASEKSGFTPHVGDIKTKKLKKKFDTVISLFHVFSYQTNNSDVQELLCNASRHLKKGGIFIFDIWYTPAVLSIYPSNRVLRMSNDEIEVTRIAEPDILINENIVNVNYQFFVKNKLNNNYETFQETHPMRHFSLPEIDYFAQKNGFLVEKSEEWITGNLPSKDTWSISLVIKKI